VAAGSFYFGEEGEDDDARDPPITANDIKKRERLKKVPQKK